MRAGRLLRAGLRTDAVEAVIRARGSDHGEIEHYDHLIRATGLDTDVARTTHPLMTHLREAGLVTADALGLGIAVGARYEVLDAHGRAVPGLHCLGPLLRARLWEITAGAGTASSGAGAGGISARRRHARCKSMAGYG